MPYDANGELYYNTPGDREEVESANSRGRPRAGREGTWEQIDRTLSDIPLIGGLFGGSSDRAEKERLRAEQQAETERLGLYAGDLDDLTAQYEMLGDDLLAGDSEAGQATAAAYTIGSQNDALQAMQDVYNHKGLTDADRNALRASQAANAQAMRSQNEAVMSNFRERGMGGGGADLAAMLSGNSALANANSQSMAGINQQAQLRALQAMQGAGNLSSNMRNSSFDESFKRGSAIDDWNQKEMDYRRGVAKWNNDTQHNQADETVRGKERQFNQQGYLSQMRQGNTDAQIGDVEGREQRRADFTQGAVDTVTDVASGGVTAVARDQGGGSKGGGYIEDEDE